MANSDILIYNENTTDVDVNPEAMALPFIDDVWRNDKIGDKSFFKKACKWIYHLYYKDHVLSGLSFLERKTYVIDTYFNGRMPTNIDGNKRILAFIDGYKLLQSGVDERLAETIKEAISIEKEKITKIKTTRKEKVEVPYDINYDFDIYKLTEHGNYRKLDKSRLTGTVKIEIDVNDSSLLTTEVAKAFKLTEQYEIAKRMAQIEKEDIKRKYEGMSILERYHAMNQDQKKSYLKG